MSTDVQNGKDVAPIGLDCPDLEPCEQEDVTRACNLCECGDALRFLKVKGVEWKREGWEEAGGGGSSAGDKGGEDVEMADGEVVDGTAGSSSGEVGRGEKPSRASEMVGRMDNRAGGKSAKSGLAEPTEISMGWD